MGFLLSIIYNYSFINHNFRRPSGVVVMKNLAVFLFIVLIVPVVVRMREVDFKGIICVIVAESVRT